MLLELRQKRNRRIFDLFKSGRTAKEIALRVGISASTVYAIREGRIGKDIKKPGV